MNFLRSIAVIIFFFISASFANAASLYIDPADGIYGEGNTFSVKVRIDTQEECINAVSATISYPNEIVKAVDVARGESILSLWTEEPEINHDDGTIHFSGGLPGGYCGRIQGDPGFTNVIAELIFQVPGLTIGADQASNSGKIAFSDDTVVLLNDGFGSKAQLFVSDSVIRIGPPASEGVSNDWFEIIRSDDIRPEPFSIELLRDESVYGGKWFIVFSTLDKQSGIDHYEIYETDIDNEGFIRNTKKEEVSLWTIGRSPYVLEDQSLNSIIRVRAIDKAGNERVAGKIPEKSLRTIVKKPIDKNLFYVIGGLVLLMIIFFIFHGLKKRKQKRRDIIGNNDDMGDTTGPPDQNEFNNDNENV